MKISANQTAQARAAQLTQRTERPDTRSIDDGARGNEGVERGQRDQGDKDAKAMERVDALADKVHARLEALAEKTGMDLSEVEAAFDDHIARLKAGLDDGSLTGRGLAQGISNTMDMLREGLADVKGNDRVEGLTDRVGGGDGRDGQSPEARIDSLAQGIEDRIMGLAEELGGEAGRGLEQALTKFGDNIDRLMAGVADGSLSGEGLEQGIQQLLSLVADDVQRGLGSTPPEVDPLAGRAGGDGATAAASSQERFEAMVSQIDDRLSGMGGDLSRADADALADLQASFSSAMDRLGAATFGDGSIGRDEFQDLLGSLYQSLQSDVQGILGQDKGASASIYHPVTGIEQLNGGVPGSLDTTV